LAEALAQDHRVDFEKLKSSGKTEPAPVPKITYRDRLDFLFD
jgi:hypothetical protein